MNILAHLALSGSSAEVRFGNFIGDAVKGRAYMDWEQPIRAGLLLHRFIDSYMDSHEDALFVRRGLAPELGLYAPVALDLLFDHLLSICWNEFYTIDRQKFIRQCYEELSSRESMMPERMAFLFRAMLQYDWLGNYHTEEGLERSMIGLSRRVKSDVDLSYGLTYFRKNRIEVLQHFRSFFPSIQRESEAQLKDFLNHQAEH
jgi:acyl carrier protein phosphodiesterase